MMRPLDASVGAVLMAVVILIAGIMTSHRAPETALDGSRAFAGTWSAVGRRQSLAIEGERTAALIELSGAVTLTAGDGVSRGFAGEAIGFDNGTGTSSGRAVWTDAHGDRLFSVLSGEPLGTGRRVTGTITGGTGRFAGAAGDYALTWQYVVADDDTVQGRAIDLRGNLHIGEVRRP